jgi:hypothetical protein
MRELFQLLSSLTACVSSSAGWSQNYPNYFNAKTQSPQRKSES